MAGQTKKQLFFASDHGGFSLKQWLLSKLPEHLPGVSLVDLGPGNAERTDYPLYAEAVARKVAAGEGLGVLICGSGIGMSIAANKFAGVRAAMVWDTTSARLCREHNNANILCLGERLTGQLVALDCVVTWWKSEFEGGRHNQRLDQIRGFEK